VVLHITAGNLQPTPFNTVCGVVTAHWRWGSKTYYLKHCLWLWYCTLHLWIYNLFPSTLPLMVILHITAWDLQLIHSTLSVMVILHVTAGDLQIIPLNTVFGNDTAHYNWGSTTHSLQHSLWCWYCTSQLRINNVFPSTHSVEILQHITPEDLHLISINTLSEGDSAHYSLGSKTYSIQHRLW
jgi:hypothetical protein